MNKYKLKFGGKQRRKALFGADGAIMAAATLAAAGMTTAATISAAKTQAKAVESSAKTQSQSIKDQTANNNALQQESINFTKDQNRENRDQQNDIQATLQMLAGKENMNERAEQAKVALKYGGNAKRKLRSTQPLYGGGRRPFTITDGGGAIPLQTDANGYGLYELYGNDHEHYHKTKSGKYKSGVGVKLQDGTVVEGEGNQNTSKGEKMYVTPNDIMFLSKHNIKGFNPSKAVDMGMNPEEAFNRQQLIKLSEGLNDDGTKMKSKDKKKALGGLNVLESANLTQLPSNNTGNIAAGITYLTNQNTNIAKFGGHRKLKHGGRCKAAGGGFWQNHAGATYGAVGNVLGAGLNIAGNLIAGNILGDAYNRAGQIMTEAYDSMKGIDPSILSREDYNAGHAMAVVRSANTNINPQLERLRRNSAEAKRTINRNTLSSAARQQKLADVDDRTFQAMGEQYAYKQNEDEKIKQANAQRIQEASAENARLDTQSRQAYGAAKMSLAQYNNNIENAKIAGKAQSQVDAMMGQSSASANALTGAMSAGAAGLVGTAQGFANSYAEARKYQHEIDQTYFGLQPSQKVDFLTADVNNKDNIAKAKDLHASLIGSNNPVDQALAQKLGKAFNFASISTPKDAKAFRY